jgi:hypothetical protein
MLHGDPGPWVSDKAEKDWIPCTDKFTYLLYEIWEWADRTERKMIVLGLDVECGWRIAISAAVRAPFIEVERPWAILLSPASRVVDEWHVRPP